jgi:hypothetical protein
MPGLGPTDPGPPAGSEGWLPLLFLRLRMSRKAMAKAKMPRTARPPTTPPTMAPTLVLLPPDAAAVVEVAGDEMVVVEVEVLLEDCAVTSGFVVEPLAVGV